MLLLHFFANIILALTAYVYPAVMSVSAIEANDYDLILMDLRMPGMDGLTAIGQIRQRDDAKKDLPIVVVTADTSVDIRERCIAGGANDLMTKPVAMKLLFQQIGKHLGK